LSPTPITAVSAEQLQTTTPTTIPDALNKLPDFIGGSTPRSQGNGSGNGSGNTLNLRALGAARTLILIDGRRVAPSNQGGTVDVDALPQMLVSRVDVVTGGASAVYGSDAVAGVVNFILDKKFNGFKYDLNAGISKYGDAAEERIGFAWGTELFGGRGHFEMSGRVFQQDMIPIAARPYGYAGNSWVLAGNGTAAAPFTNVPYGHLFNQSLTGTIKCGNTCSLTNYTFNGGGQLIPMTHGVPTTSSGVESGGDGGYADPADTTYQARQRQGEFFSRLSYDIDTDTTAFLELGASEAGNYSKWTPLAVSSAASRPNTFFTNNAYLTPAVQQQLTAAATAAGNFTPAVALNAAGTNAAQVSAAGRPYFSDAHYVNKVDGQHARAGDNIYATKGVDRNLGMTMGFEGKLLSRFNWTGFYSHRKAG
jgi:iron complex outermembrane receptor protein